MKIAGLPAKSTWKFALAWAAVLISVSPASAQYGDTEWGFCYQYVSQDNTLYRTEIFRTNRASVSLQADFAYVVANITNVLSPYDSRCSTSSDSNDLADFRYDIVQKYEGASFRTVSAPNPLN